MLSRLALVFLVCLTIFGCEGDYTIYSQNPGETVYVEIPGETVYIDVPGEGGEVWVDSFEQPYTINGMDIIWLIDKSGSMNTHANSVVTGIEQMMLSLPSSGWRLGIGLTSWSATSVSQDFPLVPGDTVQDAWDAYNNTGVSHSEAGFDALYSYLVENTYNQTWLRPDAGLLVVFVSDEEEQSTRDFSSNASGLQDFINWYGSQRQSVFLASIVNIHTTNNDCDNTISSYYVGQRYIDATQAFGGVVVDICSEDWAPGVQAALTQVEPHEEWPLTYAPLEDTIAVFEDTTPMDPANWVYNPFTNSVEFLVIPPEGTLVEIGYVIDQGQGDDDDSAGS
jgi:hypothetical protein